MSEGMLKNGLHTEYFGNGLKRQEGRTFDGNKEGKWIEWYENGQIKKEETFKNNIWHGKHSYWYESGQKMRESRDVNGEYEGIWVSWYENGQKWDKEDIKKRKKRESGLHGMKMVR